MCIRDSDGLAMLAKRMKDNSKEHKKQLHWLAQRILEEGNTKKAMAILMYSEKLN